MHEVSQVKIVYLYISRMENFKDISANSFVRNLLLRKTEIWFFLMLIFSSPFSDHQCREVRWRFESHCFQDAVWVCQWRHSTKGNMIFSKVNKINEVVHLYLLPWIILHTYIVIWRHNKKKHFSAGLFNNLCCIWFKIYVELMLHYIIKDGLQCDYY